MTMDKPVTLKNVLVRIHVQAKGIPMDNPMNAATLARLRSRNSFGRHVSLNEAELLLDEIDRLRAIVDKLPKTADGVAVTPNMEVFQIEPCGQGVNVLDVHYLTAYSRASIPSPHYYFGDCYSTEAAAIKAQKENSDG